MNRFVEQQAISITDDEATSDVAAFNAHCGGGLLIEPGDVTGSPATVTWRAASSATGDTYPAFAIDGSAAVSQTFPADTNTNGCFLPIPDEICGAPFIQAVLNTGSCSATLIKKS